VIRTDGSLGGYRGGLHRKQLLLEQEKRNVTGAGSTFTLNASSEAWSPPEKGGADSTKRSKAVAATS
jgi:hypothetical protein